jgi:hypothetical protein
VATDPTKVSEIKECPQPNNVKVFRSFLGMADVHDSKLMLDKKDFGYSFPCDGLGHGGTCDISTWNAFYLAVF